MTKEIIVTTDIPRERGFIYFVSTDEKGNICIGKTKAGRPKKNE